MIDPYGPNGHHMWCNHFGLPDAKNCKMCKGMWEKYPYDPDKREEECDRIIKENWGDSVVRRT